VLLVTEELDAGEDEESAEDVDAPVERPQQHARARDEPRAHEQRADDAPEQHAMLICRRHCESREDQQEHEDVVDAQRLLDEVAGGPLHTGVRAREDIDADVEQDSEPDPGRRPGQGLTAFDGVGMA
jgi:hypothetical protein